MAGRQFAARLRQLREAAGLTQAQLAARAGMNQFGVAKLEQGVTTPYWETVLALARALGVTCLEFAEGGEAEAPRRRPGRPPKKRGDGPAAGRHGHGGGKGGGAGARKA